MVTNKKEKQLNTKVFSHKTSKLEPNQVQRESPPPPSLLPRKRLKDADKCTKCEVDETKKN